MPKMPSSHRAISSSRAILATGRVVVATAAMGLMTACASSFFQITPEEGVAKPSTKPAEKPSEKPAPKTAEQPREAAKAPATKPAEKPAEKAPPAVKPEPKPVVPKPVEVKKEEPKKEEPKAAAPQVATAPTAPPAPPVTRRSEPVVEPAAVEPTPAGSDSAGVARLMRSAALWDAVRLFHPWAAMNSVAWDNATVRRLTDVRTANTSQQFAETVQRWLSALNDPVTEVRSAQTVRSPGSNGSRADVLSQVQTVATGKGKTRVVDSTLIITWPETASADSASWVKLRDAIAGAPPISQLVIDLRASRDVAADESRVRNQAASALQLEVASLLTPTTVAGPAIRKRAYVGWADERTATANSGEWRTGEPLVIVRGRAATNARRIVFVANGLTEMPPAIMALVSNKQATLVSDARLSDRSWAPSVSVAMGDGLTATVRTGELINADGTTGVNADTIVTPSASATDSAPSIKTALLVARGKLQLGARPIEIAGNQLGGDATGSSAWATAHYPIMGARLLALYKSWATLRNFHAYQELRDENIDEVMMRTIPRVESATDAYSYASAMLDFVSTATDAQVQLNSPTLEQHIGAASAPFAVRSIEGRAIVTRVAPTEAGKASGVIVGDEISSADGYPMPAYLNEHRRYSSSSNDWTRIRNTMAMVSLGGAGNGLYRIRDASNRERQVNIERTLENTRAMKFSDRANASVARELGTGFAYIDATRATAADVEKAFQDYASARAIVIDARGAVNTPANADAREVLPASLAAMVRKVATMPSNSVGRQTVRIVSEPCATNQQTVGLALCVNERRQRDDVIAADTARRYRGRVVVLIDERTEGAMEQFVMALESAANATLVGSSTAGAIGKTGAVHVPGVLTLTFSESEVRRPDGGQVQRVGIVPQVESQPTVRGIRAGTDEPLERAQQWLREQLDPQPVRRRR